MASSKKNNENENIVKGRTKSGIKFQIDKRITEDNRAMYFVRNMRKYKDSEDTEEKLKVTDAVYSLLELIFGSGDGLMIFMNEVALKHNGVADSVSLMKELTDIFEACNLKN